MKKLFTLALVISLTLSSFAQSPEKMSYQCVVRNASGILVANQSVGIKISILQGTASGTVIYSETYSPNPQTNANGLVTIEIGGGFPVTGTFSSINWASGPYFLKTETDPTGGTSYTITGTSQLLSVPYALHAKAAATANYNDLSNLPSLNISNWNTAYSWGNHAGLYRPVGWVPAWGDVTGKPTFATVATSGSYNDLSNKPTILNSQWTTSGSDIYYNTGNVGIGNSSPDGLLELYTNSTITYPHLLLTESEGDYSRLMFKNTAAATKNWAIAARSNAADMDSRLNFWYWDGSSGENIVSIGGSGTVTVGIGTSSPATFMQVHSNSTYVYGITPIIRISDNFKSWNIGLGDTGDRFTIASEDLTERLTILKSNGYVGIGSIAPTYKLDVAGNLNIINGRYGDALWCNGSQALWWNGTYFSWGYSSTYNYFARPITIGNVTEPTGYALWVQGNAWSTGAFLSSDARYKKNITEIENALDKIMKIRGTSFVFRTDEFKDYQFEEGLQFGFIAQELENVLPEMVKTDSNGYKSVNYNEMIPVLVEALKEQQKQINELKLLVQSLIQK
jgi:hypothetical protein